VAKEQFGTIKMFIFSFEEASKLAKAFHRVPILVHNTTIYANLSLYNTIEHRYFMFCYAIFIAVSLLWYRKITLGSARTPQ
jgi:hypothetical protein